MSYQGHKNRTHWNVSLWLFNDEGLYRTVMHYVGTRTLDEAAQALVDVLPAKTPDGYRYSKTAIRAALVGIRE